MLKNKYGMLTPIRYISGQDFSKIRWLFKCDCGVEKEILLYNVIKGKLNHVHVYLTLYLVHQVVLLVH